MGSEMCIRDSAVAVEKIACGVMASPPPHPPPALSAFQVSAFQRFVPPPHTPCLLYTSDAADERSSVDLGGRRIIKKKKSIKKKKNSSRKII